MKRLTALLTSLAFIAGVFSATTASADWNYITLSPYYLLPGQTMTVQGAGFSPGESIVIHVAGLSQTATANGSGSFGSGIFSIPFSVVHSSQTVTANGNMGHSNTANLVVGGFYPHVTPDTYYAVQGSSIHFTGAHFAPNEIVDIHSGGMSLGSATTDDSGNFTTQNFIVPFVSGNRPYSFHGQNSGSDDTVILRISGTRSVIVLDHYYGFSGENLHVRGQFFGANEPVNILMEGIRLAQVPTNTQGEFSTDILIPHFPPSSRQTVQANGQTSGQMAQAQFTIAWNDPIIQKLFLRSQIW